jgi:hypothetical protein
LCQRREDEDAGEQYETDGFHLNKRPNRARFIEHPHSLSSFAPLRRDKKLRRDGKMRPTHGTFTQEFCGSYRSSKRRATIQVSDFPSGLFGQRARMPAWRAQQIGALLSHHSPFDSFSYSN